MLLLIISCVQQGLILRSRPYESKGKNFINMLNEVAVSLNLFSSLILTDFLRQQVNVDTDKLAKLRLQVAWFITLLLIVTIFINLVYVIVCLG